MEAQNIVTKYGRNIIERTTNSMNLSMVASLPIFMLYQNAFDKKYFREYLLF